jgi:chromate transporter
LEKKVAWVAAIFYGLKPSVLAIVAAAVIRIGGKALKNEVMWTLAGLAFVAIYFFKAPFPALVFGAAIVGLAGGKFWKEKFLVIGNVGSNEVAGDAGTREVRARLHEHGLVLSDEDRAPAHATPSLARAVKVCAVCLLLWWTPVLLLGAWTGWNHTLFREGLFFSKASMVTFGGAYAVLPYVSQQAVEKYGWVTAGQMLDGLGLTETTPGPLIMVLQFVGFLGGWHHPGGLPPLLAATLGAFITTWTTFVPCFLWIFLGAPHIEQLRGNLKLASALSVVTAAVVGVILNLAVWFGLHVLFPGTNEASRSVDWFAVVVSAAAFIGMVKWKWDIVPVMLGAGAIGLVYRMLF